MLIQIIKFEKLNKFTVDFCGTVILTLERMHYAYKLKISRGISYVTQQSKMKV